MAFASQSLRSILLFVSQDTAHPGACVSSLALCPDPRAVVLLYSLARRVQKSCCASAPTSHTTCKRPQRLPSGASRCAAVVRKRGLMCRDFPSPLLQLVNSLALPRPLHSPEQLCCHQHWVSYWVSLAITVTRCLHVLRCRRQGSISYASFPRERLYFAKLTFLAKIDSSRGLTGLCSRVFQQLLPVAGHWDALGASSCAGSIQPPAVTLFRSPECLFRTEECQRGAKVLPSPPVVSPQDELHGEACLW